MQEVNPRVSGCAGCGSATDHGPTKPACKRQSDVTARIVAEVQDFRSSSHQTLTVIAKTQKQAEKLHHQLVEAEVEARLLQSSSAGFSTGVIVCTAHLPFRHPWVGLPH
jgi:Fe-S-cluster-containing dehydrogenase component